jgi:restriction system protein
MKNYDRVMLGKKSVFAEQCFVGNFIGVDFGLKESLTGKLPEDSRSFSQSFTPIWLAIHPEKSMIAAEFSCGSLWTVAKGIRIGDIVLCPDGEGCYRVGR